MNKRIAMILMVLGGGLAVALTACCAKHKHTVEFEAPIEKAK